MIRLHLLVFSVFGLLLLLDGYEEPSITYDEGVVIEEETLEMEPRKIRVVPCSLDCKS